MLLPSRKHRPIVIFSLLVLLVVLLSVTSIYFYRKYARNANVDELSQTETRNLVREVGKLVLLPENETPTIATVSDPEKLKNQDFFIDAKKGDKVLIYTNAKRAILYDPKAKKIVNIAPINIGKGGSGAAAPSGTPEF